MAPDPTTPSHVMDWMSLSLPLIGDVPINQMLWLPGSHDAGMDDRGYTYSTWGASKALTQCQTFSIRGQLKMGARWFDIRPMVDNSGTWYCGHYSVIESTSWQGATGEAIIDVINDINSFLTDHKELVVLKISHVLSCIDGAKPSTQQQRNLVNMLINGLSKYLYKDYNATTSTLNELISNKGAVVLHFTGDSDSNQGIRFPVWDLAPRLDFKLYNFNVNEVSCTSEGTFLGPSVIVDAERYQLQKLPCQSQWLEGFGNDMPGVLQIDNIYDSRLLTICLGASLARARRYITSKVPPEGVPPPIIIYGGKLISDPATLARVKDAATRNQNLLVNNKNMGDKDPWVSARKYCVVFQARPGPTNDLTYRARGAWEGEYLDFTTDITSITKNGQAIDGAEYRLVYAKLFDCIKMRDSWTISDEVVITYRSPDGAREEQRRIRPNATEPFNVEIFNVEWGGVGTYLWRPEFYEKFYDRLVRGGPPLVPNLGMFEGNDPAVGKVKQARLLFRHPQYPQVQSESIGIEYQPWQIPDTSKVIAEPVPIWGWTPT